MSSPTSSPKPPVFYCVQCGEERDPQKGHRCTGWADTPELGRIRQEMVKEAITGKIISGRQQADEVQPVITLKLLAPFLRRIVKAVRLEGQRQEDFFE